MTQKTFWRVVVILGCCFALCIPAEAQAPSTGPNNSPIGGVTTGDIVGAIVAAAAVVVVVVIVSVHYFEKANDYGLCKHGRERHDYRRRKRPPDLRALQQHRWH